ncbi:MAG: hypothetical protein U9N85_07400 [Bacteroidota bacterium]|nr:hypothetical protein [Bacteroidota bacterium]
MITWISQIQDISLIEKLENLHEENTTIPQWQKDTVLERIKTAKTKDYISRNEVAKL